MAKKKTNPIIEEQRRARQEFLKLKKMQNGEISPPPKPSEVEKKPKTVGEKVKNIWYHDKYFIIGAIVTCIVIVFMVAQCVNKVNPDIQVVVFTSTGVSDESCKNISNYASKHCKDVNGDGEVNVQVVNCSFSDKSGDSQYKQTMLTKLQSMIAAEESALLFIVDGIGEDYFNSNISEYMFKYGIEPLSENFYNECAITEEQKKNPLCYELPENLKIGIRDIDVSLFKNKKNIEKIVDASESVYSAFTE